MFAMPVACTLHDYVHVFVVGLSVGAGLTLMAVGALSVLFRKKGN